jgi:hydroxyacylglutathione hydrolase
MRVLPVPCLRDNYAYLLAGEGAKTALVVDPSEAGPVLAALEQHGLELVGILNTHHHHDHVGGNEELVRATGVAEVCGHASDRGRIPGQTRFLEHGATLELAGLRFRILHVPGHTRGAVSYVADAPGGGAVFTGDTMFAGGCGRLFEGTAAEMYESLNVKLGALPDETRVYCGHEYTANNLRFAAALEPDNAAVAAKAARVSALRARGEPTVPSTIGEERATNPFMRCAVPAVARAVAARLDGRGDPVSVLGAVRAAKDAF